MLSRRNVRIKVMQILYSLGREKSPQKGDVLRQYQQSISHSFEMYLFQMMLLRDIAAYASKDAGHRKAKLRPTPQDLAFTPRLRENPLTEALLQNAELQRYFNAYRLPATVDDDDARRFYMEFAKTEEYQDYLTQDTALLDTHQNALLALVKFLNNDEAFNDYMEDHYSLWRDDKSLVVGAMKKTVKALPPEDEDFFKEHEPTDETIKEFGEQLLLYAIAHDKDLLDLIQPALNNWDADRVAIIDMILIKMALSEFLNFPTIPTKVTLNEFVDIAKMYSTEKSKEFVNGILDRLMKQLQDEGRIAKEGRGLTD